MIRCINVSPTPNFLWVAFTTFFFLSFYPDVCVCVCISPTGYNCVYHLCDVRGDNPPMAHPIGAHLYRIYRWATHTHTHRERKEIATFGFLGGDFCFHSSAPVISNRPSFQPHFLCQGCDAELAVNKLRGIFSWNGVCVLWGVDLLPLVGWEKKVGGALWCTKEGKSVTQGRDDVTSPVRPRGYRENQKPQVTFCFSSEFVDFREEKKQNSISRYTSGRFLRNIWFANQKWGCFGVQ